MKVLVKIGVNVLVKVKVKVKVKVTTITLSLGCLVSCTSLVQENLEYHSQEHQAQEHQTHEALLNFAGIDSLDFFSSFMSESAISSCSEANIQCVDDPITPQLWFKLLAEELLPLALTRSQNVSNYELLVASQLKEIDSKDHHSGIWKSLQSEFTLQWRGVALDTYSTSAAPNKNESNDYTIETLKMIRRWKTHAASVGIFSRDFLYSSLQASDYRTQLSVPSHLKEFYLEDTQLYADPFEGAVSRYRHPAFDKAILDISVSPALAKLVDINDLWLQTEITKDMAKAERLSEQQQMVFTVDNPITPITMGAYDGFYFSVHALDEFDEPLYATTYLFLIKDKLIKFTSSFPYEVAQPLVEDAIVRITVPDESVLMRQMRSLF